jgi:tRNA(fMet)-specific endonuclease VapC
VTHLLDTDHLTILQYPTSSEYPILAGHMSRHPAGDVVTSVISVQEQMRGAHTQINRARTSADVVRGYDVISRILRVIAPFTVLPFDDPAAVVSDQLRARRIRIGTMDLRIAAVALSRSLVVVTRNAQDFGQVPGLVTEDWTR